MRDELIRSQDDAKMFLWLLCLLTGVVLGISGLPGHDLPTTLMQIVRIAMGT
jgi:hypothetical protein